jgi:DHA2 family multidrug resistance protein-like MFS transporter
MIGLIALTYAVKELAKRDASMTVFASALILGLIATTIFVRRQFSSKEPLIDFSLFNNRLFSTGVFAALVASGSMTGMELVFSQRMQLIEGMTPLQAGLMILPIPLAAFVAGPLAGMMLPRLGAGKVLWASLGITALGVVIYILTYKLSTHFYLAGLAVLGFGVGCAMTGASSSIMGNAPAEKAGMAASVEEVSFELGNALGVTIFGSILSAFYTASLILPAGSSIPSVVRDSLDEALLAAQSMPEADAYTLTTLASQAFENCCNLHRATSQGEDRVIHTLRVTAIAAVAHSLVVFPISNSASSPAAASAADSATPWHPTVAKTTSDGCFNFGVSSSSRTASKKSSSLP